MSDDPVSNRSHRLFGRQYRLALWAAVAAREGIDMTDDTTDLAPAAAKGPWAVTDQGSAEWAMRKVRTATQAIARIDAQAIAWRAEVEEWREAEQRPHRATIERMSGLLEDWALREREAGGSMTQRLPSGSVRTRQTGARVEVTDESAAIRWLAERAEDGELDAVTLADITELRLVRGRLSRHVTTAPEVVTMEGCGHDAVPDPAWPMEVGEDAPCTVCGQVSRVAECWGGVASLEPGLEGCPGLEVAPARVTVTVSPRQGSAMPGEVVQAGGDIGEAPGVLLDVPDELVSDVLDGLRQGPRAVAADDVPEGLAGE